MFVNAIENVSAYTRPVYIISRYFNSREVRSGAATLFFVNESGVAITCKHVANDIIAAQQINEKYNLYKNDRCLVKEDSHKKEAMKKIAHKYDYNADMVVQIKINFIDSVDHLLGFDCILHPQYDLAIIKFHGKPTYQRYAIFLKNAEMVKQGKYLCRLGYPFPEYKNYQYNPENDDIEWIDNGGILTPRFPIEGMVTRHIADNGKIVGIELSTPGLRGQSGGPLFDSEGIIYGMQSQTKHLHLGFDVKDIPIPNGNHTVYVSNQPFLHLGHCVHVDIIKEFLRENNVRYYEQ